MAGVAAASIEGDRLEAEIRSVGRSRAEGEEAAAHGPLKGLDERAMRYAGREVNTVGTQIWANPIYWWSASERDAYIRKHGLPVNPVSAALGMSGECLCGAYAHKGEKAMVKIVCPQTAARIERLEQEVFDAGWNWGWEGKPPRGGASKAQTDMFRPLCVGCEKVAA